MEQRRAEHTARGIAMFGFRPQNFPAANALVAYEKSDLARDNSNHLDRMLREKIG